MSNFPRVPGFILTEKLGSGSYATVFKAFRKGDGGRREVVAIKCVEKASLTKSAVDNLITEIALLKKLKHKHIVEMKDFLWDDKHIFIIMEFCGGGDLSTCIRKRRSLPEQVVKRFLQQLAQALQYLRSENVCHMDLKPQNILLTSSHPPSLKLADFGFAQYLESHDDATSLRGSPLYMAPEILLRHKYDARVDLWSIGVILYECLFGQAPYSSRTFTELAEKIKDPRPIEVPYGVTISANCRDLLTRLLQRDPEERLTFEEFFNHNFLDLKHIPSHSSYATAVDLFTKAVKNDQERHFTTAAQLYFEGLQFLVPAIQYETDPIKKEAMRTKAREYMSRAEQLKEIIKPNLVQPTATTSPVDELVHLSADLPPLHAAIKVAQAAEHLESQERLEEAMEKYRLALGVLLPILADEAKSRRRELLSVEVQRWMDRAEAIKLYLKVNTFPVEENDMTDINDGVGSLTLKQCCLQ